MYSRYSIKRCYRTKKDDVTRELIIPLLKHSVKYDRGTGFFSVQALANMAEGLIPYIRNGGSVRIITSVKLGEEEQNLIAKGEEVAKALQLSTIEGLIEKEVLTEENLMKMDLIVNLIAAKRLEIRVGYIENGLYHEKIGLFEDEEGEKVCYIGSANETYSGFERNRESICVLKSWQGDMEDIREQEEYFDKLWKNRDDEVRVFKVSEAVEKKLIDKFKYSGSVEGAIERIYNNKTNKKKKKELYEYQKEAIKQFTNNGYCHFYEMATGTGKTFTAVKSIEECANNINPLFVVIIVPQIDLQIQWERALKDVGFNSFLFGGASKEDDWIEAYNHAVIEYYNSGLSIILSVYDTYFSKLSARIDMLNENKLIIVDEAHELSRRQIGMLSASYKYRLGLSATPERHDISETKNIIKYFTKGQVETYKYTIDEAIGKFLCRYEYHPEFVYMTEDKYEQYKSYTMQLVYLFNQKYRDYDAIKEKSNRRSVLVKKAENKLAKIHEMILNNYNFQNAVVYCGQGKDDESEEAIIDIVTRYLSVDGKYNVSQFTSKTENRDRVLQEFENGYYDTLVAIKCFDQGVDVPKLDKIYIMASDALQRQTIQRRGRVLRQCTETGKELAHIYDLVVLPPEGVYDGIGAKAMVVNEFKRVKEYMRLSENVDILRPIIEDLENQYAILEEDYSNEREEE